MMVNNQVPYHRLFSCAETLLASAAFAARLLAALSIHWTIIAHGAAQLGESGDDAPRREKGGPSYIPSQ